MIGKITGRLEFRGADHVMIDTGGVAYVIFCSERTLAAMPGPGERVALYTELLVREDLLQLFGFRTLAEREWHRLLTSVQGVGAKGALAVMGALGSDGIARALSLGDVSAIRSAPGIGPKIAQRMVLELQAKAPAVMAMGAQGAETVSVSGDDPVIEPVAKSAKAPKKEVTDGAKDAAAQADALSALVNLGYGQGEAAAAVAEAADGGGKNAQDLIRIALRGLAPQG
ncbi:Holliday junction branch migration protein RuvA [Amaricoccus tamworthensis]|uniref:Holliday junction branch migration protein RuvA n=1 Tax=Amaricoccus tamworthensis TaxID=57002 RepID=UPI003C7D9F48